MFSTIKRLQDSFSAASTFALVLCCLIFTSSYVQLLHDRCFDLPSTISDISLDTSLKFSRIHGSLNKKPKENARLTSFSLQTDLSPLFNLNTKQVFVYLTAEYHSVNRKDNSISNKLIFWDKIIISKDDATLNLTNLKSKYSVYDIEKSFNHKNATVRLEWNIQPWVGPLIYGSTTGLETITFI
ncbi:signal peptidase complex subunit SPC3 [Ascoidea rubescens DSM 1968]|uniref:Signal peptidase subunit 3 n=1 Tax=Ascoidea rubescens DSM 1968 TaxID=1344418 RepID=A0A1D2VR87_9ASCO|nr:signal peptidase 22 kDa subunit [Ascoidea rubescens DSM 1968]ODV64109.1 signal peptidase 22 kDa subunit [Ascoidea rubescens DSM 1968]